MKSRKKFTLTLVTFIFLSLAFQSCSFVQRCPTYTSACNLEKRNMYLKKMYKEWHKNVPATRVSRNR